jgi:hypothetical protein
MRIRIWTGSVGALAAAATLAACSPRGGEEQAAEPPRVAFLAPVDGDTVESPVTVRLVAWGVEIVPASGLREEGKAHHHVLINADLQSWEDPIPVSEQHIHMGTGATDWVLEHLTPGSYRLIAVMAWGDHVPMAGAVTDTIHIVVR